MCVLLYVVRVGVFVWDNVSARVVCGRQTVCTRKMPRDSSHGVAPGINAIDAHSTSWYSCLWHIFCLVLIRINTFQFCGKFHCFLSSIFFGTWVGDVGMYFCVVMSTGCRGG